MNRLLFLIIPICLNQFDQFFYSLFFRNVFLDTFLFLVQADFPSSGSYITVVCIGHFTGTIDNTSHNADFQPFQVRGRSFDTGNSRFQVV